MSFIATLTGILTGSQPEAAQAWGATHYPGAMQKTATDFILLLSEQSGLPVRQIKPTDRFIEDLKLVELESVEVIIAVEELFKLGVADEDAERLATVHEFICYLHERIHSAK